MRYLIVDTETAGLNPPKIAGASGVAEIAYIEINEQLAVMQEWESMCCPGVPMDPGASKVNGIYDKDVEGLQTLEEVFHVIEPAIHIGHNASFDLKFAGHCYDNLAGSLCTLAMARQYIRDSVNHKLGTLADHLNIDKGTAHRALGDCHTTLGILKVLVERSGRPLPDLIAAARNPQILHTMTFGIHKGKLLKDLPLNYIRWFDDKEIDPSLRKSFDIQLKIRG